MIMKKIAFLVFGLFIISQAYSQSYTSWLEGSADDVETDPTPGIVLAGGGGDNNDAMTWLANRADGGDVVVIRASGEDGYNDYIYGLSTVNSVETILINSKSIAEIDEVEQKIRNAEALFIAGGNQWDYVSYWRDTPVEDAINYLINEKGAPVGGTSAGCAILGKVYFSAENGTVTSSQALINPYRSDVTLERDDFLNVTILENTVTDTHYDDRSRNGRHTAFLARMVTDWSIEAKGIGVNEYTAVCIDENGIAKVFGNTNYDDYAYFLKAGDEPPETCESGSNLTWNRDHKAVKVYKIHGSPTAANSFDLNDWETGTNGSWEYWYVIEAEFSIEQENTAVHENVQNINLTMYPNPAKHFALIGWQNEEFSVEIIDQTGKIIATMHDNVSQAKVDVSSLGKGIYFFRLKNHKNQKTVTKKIIIQK